MAAMIKGDKEIAATQVLFYPDGGGEYGYGSLVRSNALASELSRRGIRVSFLTANDEVRVFLSKEWDADRFINIGLHGAGSVPPPPSSPRVFVRDSRSALSREDVRGLHDKGIYVIELDRADGESYADEMVNGFERAVMSGDNRSFTLCGPDYLLLRSEFSGPSVERAKDEKADHLKKNPMPGEMTLFVNFGGSDTAALLTPVLRHLLRLDNFNRMKLLVVTGFNADTHNDELKEYHCFENIKFYSNVSAGEVAALMRSADLAVVSFGTVMLEALAAGLPVLTINPTPAHEEYSKRVFNGIFKDAGKSFGATPNIDWLGFADELREFFYYKSPLMSMAEAASDLIDGRGIYRVADHIENICAREVQL